MLTDQLPGLHSGFLPGLQADEARPSDHRRTSPDPGPVCMILSPLLYHKMHPHALYQNVMQISDSQGNFASIEQISGILLHRCHICQH